MLMNQLHLLTWEVNQIQLVNSLLVKMLTTLVNPAADSLASKLGLECRFTGTFDSGVLSVSENGATLHDATSFPAIIDSDGAFTAALIGV